MSSEARVNAATGLIPSPNKTASDMNYVSGNAISGYRYVAGPGEEVGADSLMARPTSATPAPPAAAEGPSLTVQGLPLNKPPYGMLNAVSLDRGEILWQVANGETPDGVRNHPALKGLNPGLPASGVHVIRCWSIAVFMNLQFTVFRKVPEGNSAFVEELP